MASKKFTRAELEATVKKFLEEQKLNKTTLSFDWMDNYVAKFYPEKIGEWVKKCASIPKKPREADGKEVKDIEAVRTAFIAEYFPDFTEEAIEKRKAEKKAQREAEKAEKERIKALPLEEQLKLRLEALKED